MSDSLDENLAGGTMSELPARTLPYATSADDSEEWKWLRPWGVWQQVVFSLCFSTLVVTAIAAYLSFDHLPASGLITSVVNKLPGGERRFLQLSSCTAFCTPILLLWSVSTRRRIIVLAAIVQAMLSGILIARVLYLLGQL